MVVIVDVALVLTVLCLADEYGRPFIILKEQQAKARVKGLEAVKVGSIFSNVYGEEKSSAHW